MKKSIFTLLFTHAFMVLSAQDWQPLAEGLLPNGYVIFSISAVGDNVVWAVASKEYYQGPIPSSHHSYVLRTADGGQNWTTAEIEEAAGTISFQIVAVDSLTAWITTQDYNSGPGRALYQTIDGGVVWTKKHTNVAAGVALNYFSDGQHWLAHNRQATCRSANNGQTWTNATFTGYQTDEYQILNSGANVSSTVGDTLWNGTSAGRIVRFTNYGQEREFLNTGFGPQATITSIAFHDHQNGLLYYPISSFGLHRIARSTDGGATWTPLMQQPGNFGWNITVVPGSPGTYVLASNYNTNSGRVAITKDFGASWSVENLNKSLNAVVFTNSSTGWIGAGKITSSATPALFKYTGASLVGTQTPVSLPGFSVSPNPSADIVRFEFEGSGEASSVLATITDVSGRNVFSGKIFDKQLDISMLDAGVYFLKIEAGGKVGIEKLVKN